MPFDINSMTDEELVAKLEAMLDDKAMAEKLAATSAHMQSSRGTEKAAKLLSELAGA